jgi:signal transduction histidine kinase
VTAGGRGVLGMHERAQLVGGSLHAATRPDGGFEVSAVLPYQNSGALR